ncbi:MULTISPECIES: hypothetical protein [Borreliella]|uniref:hypothetical protein n=1 Tax=Borreliella TaxID=64895 RepID=UPI001CF4EEFC|nr:MULTISPECIES: hypothetical protein [Borreliella]WLN24754.1 hypothetical protein IDK87_05905 [Borreliella bavariensis]
MSGMIDLNMQFFGFISCIRDLYSPDVKYFNYNESVYTNDAASKSTIDEQYFINEGIYNKGSNREHFLR